MKQMSIKKSFLMVALMLLFVVGLTACGKKSDAKKVQEALETLEVGFQTGDTKDSVTKDVTLPTTVGDVTITWTSSDQAIAATGKVTRSYVTKEVTLTATLTLGEESEVATFVVTVVKLDDKVAPAFMGAIAGKLPTLTHLQTETVDLLEGIQARDNVDNYDVVITIDEKLYDKDVAGTYTVTYTAEDKSGNKASIDRDIVVEEALDVTLNAAVIGENWIEYVYNDDTAFENAGTYGARFRQVDKLFIMSKAFFTAQVAEHGAEYPTNGNLPLLPYGSLIVTDKDYNIIHARFQTGVFLQMDVVDGVTVTSHTDVVWNTGGGGSLFTGIESIIPEDGYIMFIAPAEPQKARVFLVSNLFFSEYTGGAVTKDAQDIFELTQIDLQLVEGYRVLIKLPAPVATPVAELNRHTLSWAAVPNAMNYQLFVNGVAHGQPMTATSVDLSALELEISDVPYEITVVANSKDKFQWSNSVASNVIEYTKIEIQTLAAPVVTVTEKVLSWDAVEGTSVYEVYLKLGAYTKLVGTTENTTFDVSSITAYNGVNGYEVKGIGLATHTDSVMSNVVLIDQTVVTEMMIGGMKTNVVIMTAEDYFNRRNLTDGSKLGSYIFLVTNLETVTAWSGIYNEAFSTVAILNSEYQATLVRNILAKQTYTKELGWFEDTEYANNGSQTIGFAKYVKAGDMLLIGKNGLNVSFDNNGTAGTIGARDFIAYHFVNSWETFPTAPVAPNGWRAPITSFKDASTTVVSFVVAE